VAEHNSVTRYAGRAWRHAPHTGDCYSVVRRHVAGDTFFPSELHVQLLIALIEPMLYQISQVVEMAESQRTPRIQMDTLVQGFARVVARNRSLPAVMVFDPDVHRILQLQPDWRNLIARQLAILTQLNSGPTGIVKATALLTGLSGAATGAPLDIDEDALTQELCEIGRRIIGLRSARRQVDSQRITEGGAPRRPQTDTVR
jgi:hypothetical protein